MKHKTHSLFSIQDPGQLGIPCWCSVPRTSAALLPVLGPSLSNTLGRRDGAAGLLLVLVVVLLLLSDMVFEFSTVTFRLILDILQDCAT